MLDRLLRKFDTARKLVPKPIVEQGARTDIAIVSIGSSDGAVREALDLLAAQGVPCNYLRIRAFPFGDEVERFLEDHRVLFVVEQNRDAQLKSLLTLETRVEKSKLRSLLHYNGLPVSSQFIVEGVLAEVQRGTLPAAGLARPAAGAARSGAGVV